MDAMEKTVSNIERRKHEARQYVISPLARDRDEVFVWIIKENSRREEVISTWA
jgi:hypothetical protein